MARFIRRQDLIAIEVDEDGDLVLTQVTDYEDERKVITVNFQNIESFINAITGAVKDGYKGDEDEMV